MSQSITAQIAEIQSLGIPELRGRWRTLFGTEPPGYSKEHMCRRLAYRVQELAHGGLPDATRATLRAVAERDGACTPGARLVRRKANDGAPVPGTRLVREWHGERHEVTVVVNGFEYRGRLFRSLSAVAREITGSRWNGRLYFGLRDRKKGS